MDLHCATSKLRSNWTEKVHQRIQLQSEIVNQRNFVSDSTEMSMVDMCKQRSFCLSTSVQVLPLGVTKPRDSCTWNDSELAILLTLSESLAEGGFEPLTIRSMRKNLTTELS